MTAKIAPPSGDVTQLLSEFVHQVCAPENEEKREHLRRKESSKADGRVCEQGSESECQESSVKLWSGRFDYDAVVAWAGFSVEGSDDLHRRGPASTPTSGGSTEGCGRGVDQGDEHPRSNGRDDLASVGPVGMDLARTGAGSRGDGGERSLPERSPGRDVQEAALSLRRVDAEVVQWSFSVDPLTRVKEALRAHRTIRSNGETHEDWIDVALEALEELERC